MEYSQLSGNDTFLISLAVTTGEPNTTDSDEVISGEDSGRTDFQSRWCHPSEYNRAVDARNYELRHRLRLRRSTQPFAINRPSIALTQHSNQVSTNTGLCRGETRFCRAETKAPKRLLKSNQQPAEAKCALLTKDEARRIAANVAKLPERKD
jgi:hypothetical protein